MNTKHDFSSRVRVAGASSALALILAFSGCATTPQVNPQLELARAAVQRAESDPATVKGASLDLQKAQDLLRQASDAHNSRKDDVLVTHLAYLATQEANIALARGEEKTAIAAADQAKQQRDQVRLQAREAEVDRAKDATRDAEEAVHEAQLATVVERARSAQLAAELNAKQTDRGMVLTLGDVLFDTGKSELKPGARRTVDKLAEFLKDNPDRTVRVEGFTDTTGSEDYNLMLSEKRADSVRQAILAEGVANERVQSKGFGEQYAVVGNDTAAGRQQNRRVEIVISDESGKIGDRS